MKNLFISLCLMALVSVPALAGDAQTRPNRADSDAERIEKKTGESREEIQHEMDESVMWMKIAARHGNPDAIFLLGYSYATGVGVPQDYEEAEFWLALAAAQGGRFGSSGDPVASRLAEVEKHLTADQIAAAKKRAREWRPEPLSGSVR